MIKPTKSDDDLAPELEHPLYEIWMMLEAVNALNVVGKLPLQVNLELESFVIHARCLEEFFASKSKKPDTMSVIDFVPNFSVAGMDSADLNRMHGEVAHLTYRRKKSGSRGEWAIDKVGEPIFKASLKFLNEIKCRPALMAYVTHGKTNGKRTLDLITELEERIKRTDFLHHSEHRACLRRRCKAQCQRRRIQGAKFRLTCCPTSGTGFL